MYVHAGNSLKASKAIQVMETITYGNEMLPKRIKVDNVSRYISKILDRRAYENEVELDFSRPEKPPNNLFIKSFNASTKDECLKVN
ncbi:MAG TPA: hypothetical protein ENH87_09870 [Pricia antarctica]|uniref:Integrase catalytic domain-containing protein n=1 Tax=Pricia antarctica TaxID=641691 RepID=A0A831VRS0_9FLAO|nr:hypothetical protein [Pricia antarctica]